MAIFSTGFGIFYWTLGDHSTLGAALWGTEVVSGGEKPVKHSGDSYIFRGLKPPKHANNPSEKYTHAY